MNWVAIVVGWNGVSGVMLVFKGLKRPGGYRQEDWTLWKNYFHVYYFFAIAHRDFKMAPAAVQEKLAGKGKVQKWSWQ